MSSRASALLWVTLTVAGAGCVERFTEPQRLGGVSIAPEVLERGRAVYTRECSGCHGDKGEGGRSANPREPAPRDLRLGIFKYSSNPGDGLPTDADLIGVVRSGLDGTRMVARPDLDQRDVEAVIQFIKTLSPRWRAETQPTPPAPVPDPWGPEERSAAISRGFAVYHWVARCWTCHPAYMGRSMLSHNENEGALLNADSVQEALEKRGDISVSAAVETRFGIVLPPDFLGDRVRAAKGPVGLYRAIAVGVGGTPMPAWAGRLSPKDLWAVIHYVQELTRVRGTPGAGRYRLGVPGEPAGAPASSAAPGSAHNAAPPGPIPGDRKPSTEIKGY